MVFHWCLSDSKSPQVSKTRFRILAVLSNAVVWIVSTRPPTSKSSRPFNNPLVIVPNAPQCPLVVVHSSLSDSKSTQVSRTLLSILADRNNADVCMVFHWTANEGKSSQFSKTLLDILADVNNTAFCIVSILSLISNSSSLISKLLGIVSSTSTIISIIVTLMFHRFFCSLAI